MVPVLINAFQNRVQFDAAKATGTFKRDRLKPYFRHHVLPLHVDVRRLAPIQRYKEKPLGPLLRTVGIAP